LSTEKKKKSGTSRITGIVRPSKKSEAGQPPRIIIHTDDDREYRIDFSGAGKELRNLVDAKVLVHGKIREQLNGQETLTVRKYQVICLAN